jgi:hypothetical protein
MFAGLCHGPLQSEGRGHVSEAAIAVDQRGHIAVRYEGWPGIRYEFSLLYTFDVLWYTDYAVRIVS